MQSLENAKMVIQSGAGLEDFIEDVTGSVLTIVDASEGISLHCNDGHFHNEHEHHHDVDPHYWLSPANARIMAINIHAALAEAYPKYVSTFANNFEILNKQINELAEYAEMQLGSLSCRKLVTFHDGFSYMAEAFDMEILHAVAEESGSEASAQELIALTKLVEKHHLPAVFTERNGSTSAASIVAKETETAVYSLDMAMSGDSYFDAMYHNINTLKEALE